MSEKNTNVTETVEIDQAMGVMPEEVDPGMSVMPGPGVADTPTVIPELDSMLAVVLDQLPAYTTTDWKNKPSTATPVTAEIMKKIEQRLVDLTSAYNNQAAEIKELRDSVSHLIEVPSSYATGDLNKYTTEGRYSITQDSALSNFPEGAYSFGNLIVMKSYDCITQLYTPHLTGQGGEQRFLYVRVYFGANWGNWYKAQLQ